MTANPTSQILSEHHFLKTMINAYFGTSITPFEADGKLENVLLMHQKQCFLRIKEQSFLGGLTVIVGEPGTGKTIFKQALLQLSNKHWHVIVINRSIFSWHSFLSLLTQALQLEQKGRDSTLEKNIVAEARKLNQRGKSLIFIIDDAHLIPQNILKKLRLLLEDFPKNHNLVLIGQLELMTLLKMRDNDEIRSRITQSAEFKPLSPNDIITFIHHQLDRSGLPHNTFNENALNLINKACNGNLRATKNLCLGSMVEAVRAQTKCIDIEHVNRVLDQPHWRHSNSLEGREPLVFTNQRPNYKDKDLS